MARDIPAKESEDMRKHHRANNKPSSEARMDGVVHRFVRIIFYQVGG